MQINTDTNPPILPQNATPPVTEQALPSTPLSAALVPQKKWKLVWWLVPIGIIVFLAAGSMLVRTTKKVIEQRTTITPTPTSAVYVVNRELSNIATESAFLKFETDLASLTLGVRNVQIQNQQLLPPRMDLPLGFSR